MEGYWFLAPTTTAIATIFGITSVSTEYWTQTSSFAHAGLWKLCINQAGTWFCRDTKWSPAGMSISSCIHCAIAIFRFLVMKEELEGTSAEN